MKIDAFWIIVLALLMMPIIVLLIDMPKTILIMLMIILTPILIINILMLLSRRIRGAVLNILIWFWVVLKYPHISKEMMIIMIKKGQLMSQMIVRKMLLRIVFLPAIIYANIKTISQMIKIIMIRMNVNPVMAEKAGLIVEVISIIMIILLMMIIQNIILPAIS
ncbi:MAG: hypothetical protein COV98_01550 [Candidatus Altarchaeum sp. CG12_big_fil_rev_8_21_14_0_65_33_22]|uniref:Uncharacterized protein n=1 Tax=Candidatus Altarchaeum hamiconexum TaxID=1803513 RepID=A0A8J7YV69_9ARCH|nr:hypothetical protein [Candidatus Altarchaeum hamiconexum]OIQ04749.1 MAG: hypothetical protein AUK59_06480 [Candidatus Altarchaeum sp. CG2_30_32_3053]PIN67787.1 MAG: hypothetical protein COV98_01550 [Candidatus Altarchaeum sp. CG12_big_fil_rev_8_21_14_0_65_33_22]PIV28586.1 MAG: hypothetical protein COS36_01685 [Candidatus Altarchaeum sp. CG03_land_8_20_14_0_80_32_618]PIX48786.1 MAG: hypothetical protein COZ53_02885 [Candidatus Altarchaeum sp. CG_4_8_14_3_um_filter_33_2054]PIZ30975.1 MAG: hyp